MTVRDLPWGLWWDGTGPGLIVSFSPFLGSSEALCLVPPISPSPTAEHGAYGNQWWWNEREGFLYSAPHWIESFHYLSQCIHSIKVTGFRAATLHCPPPYPTFPHRQAPEQGESYKGELLMCRHVFEPCGSYHPELMLLNGEV